MTDKKPTPSYTAEFRARGVRLFHEHRSDYSSDSAAYRAIASKLGCSSISLRDWCRRAARDAGALSGPTSEEKARIKALERENRELRQANEILKKGETIFRHWSEELPVVAPLVRAPLAGRTRISLRRSSTARSGNDAFIDAHRDLFGGPKGPEIDPVDRFP